MMLSSSRWKGKCYRQQNIWPSTIFKNWCKCGKSYWNFGTWLLI